MGRYLLITAKKLRTQVGNSLDATRGLCSKHPTWLSAHHGVFLTPYSAPDTTPLASDKVWFES